MAITKIWSRKGSVRSCVEYAKNPDKTEQNADTPDAAENLDDKKILRQLNEENEAMSNLDLESVFNYVSNEQKTKMVSEDSDDLKQYVSGVNCDPGTACEEMAAVKKKFGKTGGVVLYHGTQAFMPGEITPDVAHEIGVKLAERLWGSRYQVVVSTHLDQAHIHNHFVVNTVSMVDGLRYYRSNKDYWNMRRESDDLCQEYGLSVLEDSAPGKSKQYGEWKADKEGKSTYRGMVKSDIDQAILESVTEKQLWDNLYRKGYRIKFGQDITIRLEGKERGIKLLRNFGEDYSIGAIRRRILANTNPLKPIHTAGNQNRGMVSRSGANARDRQPYNSHQRTARRPKGFRAVYYSYLYRLGVLPKKKYHRKQPAWKVERIYREDLRYIRNISQEARILSKHGIDTAGQLAEHKAGLAEEMINLSESRKQLRNQSRNIRDEEKVGEIKTKISALSEQIGQLRKEVKLCEDIEERSSKMAEKMDHENELNQDKTNRREENEENVWKR